MAFTDLQIEAIRNRLGYGNLTSNARPYFDVARVFEDVIKNYTDATGIQVVAHALVQLNAIDGGPIGDGSALNATGGLLGSASPYYVVKELVGEVVFDTSLHQRYLVLQNYWINRIEETLMVKHRRKLEQNCGEVY